jgi:hypothetical protein
MRWLARGIEELKPTRAQRPKRAMATVGGRTHRLVWADRHAGYRMKCSCGGIDPKLRWRERGAVEQGNRRVRAVQHGQR